ncbi:13038_t:CDS:1, partial [Gigaspora margarita]
KYYFAISNEDVPKISTIQNWIGCYAHQHHEQAAQININT